MKTSQNPISLYIHWPYCLSKCPYCDFASHVCTSVDEETLWHGYQRDIDRWIKGRPIATIFFGGGTPSLMSTSLTDKILKHIAKRAQILPDCEITMEANPDAIDKNRMKTLRYLGINRLSLGVQALDSNDLAFLGRRHSVQTALTRIAEAQSVFERVSIDLIYARPHQTQSAWEKELKQAIQLGLSHYSLYQLTIEPNTVFGQKNIRPLDDATAARLYRMTDEIMNAAGLPAYEVSNYAHHGQECRHNLAYWHTQDYIGIGPAAHGRIGLTATYNPASVSTWIRQGTAVESLTPHQKGIEQLLMGLRLRQEWFPATNLDPNTIQKLVRQGLLEFKNNAIRPTLEGTLILDTLILALIPSSKTASTPVKSTSQAVQ